MLNYKELRREYKTLGRKDKEDLICQYLIGIVAIAITLVFIVAGYAHAYTVPLNDKNAILTIMAEGEGESYLGKVALAKTLLNRNTLDGADTFKNVIHVNGIYYKSVSKKSKYYKRTGRRLRPMTISTYADSVKAWEYAKETKKDSNWIATGWGNATDLELFKKTSWFGKCRITDNIGAHWFYVCEEKGDSREDSN